MEFSNKKYFHTPKSLSPCIGLLRNFRKISPHVNPIAPLSPENQLVCPLDCLVRAQIILTAFCNRRTITQHLFKVRRHNSFTPKGFWLQNDRKYSGIYLKNFTTDHSFKVSICSQHLLRYPAATIVYHTLCMCALDARFLHSFSCCWQDGGSPKK